MKHMQPAAEEEVKSFRKQLQEQDDYNNMN
jgi:hypothetical protein